MDRDSGRNEGREEPEVPPRQRSAPTGAEFAAIGLQFGLTIVVFVFAGVWLDRHFGTSPWLTIGCTFAGAGGGFYSMYLRATAAQRDGGRGQS